MAYLSVAEMASDEGDAAYALVRTLDPGLGPACWSAFIEAQHTRGGILVLRTPDRTVMGLASWHVADCAGNGRLMVVENFVTAELSAATPGRRRLAGAIEALARARGCRGIRRSPGDRPGSAETLRNHVAISRNPPLRRSRSGSAAEMYPAL
ncbi:hypothetical protein [Sphingomonas psychrotolerans]|uniref:N-acetyltransferase domain-containing protein n=1 Tax=Sphingomonas psychrotolerans TaxID=1327635 RepID=A0A2K8MQ31_9SPHN|nr:hypothetical protein [Sphingomonas psychrotolerans]ATY33551.1 hypothetical protein CVN68_17590 [Sphingomonas psychrotolerans]